MVEARDDDREAQPARRRADRIRLHARLPPGPPLTRPRRYRSSPEPARVQVREHDRGRRAAAPPSGPSAGHRVRSEQARRREPVQLVDQPGAQERRGEPAAALDEQRRQPFARRARRARARDRGARRARAPRARARRRARGRGAARPARAAKRAPRCARRSARGRGGCAAERRARRRRRRARAGARRAAPRRAVSSGSSASAVAEPIHDRIASRARSRCTCARARRAGDPARLAARGGDAAVERRGELQRDEGPPALDDRQEAAVLLAALRVEDARSRRRRRRRAAARTPAGRRRGFGSRGPIQTRAMPALEHARRLHGPVRAGVVAGLERDGERRAAQRRCAVAAARRARAPRPPRAVRRAGCVRPAPSTRSPRTTTAPTGGFGQVRPDARRACASASRIAFSGCTPAPATRPSDGLAGEPTAAKKRA